MCYASSPSIRTCPPSLGPTIPTPPLMTASASKSSCSVNSPPTSSRGTRPVKRMPCLNSRMAGQTACSSGAAGRHRSGRSVSSTRLGRSLTGFGCLMISNLPRGATLAHSGYRGLYGRGNAPGPFLLCPCSRATWALFFSPPPPPPGEPGEMPPPRPPPNTHRGGHGAWIWETACGSHSPPRAALAHSPPGVTPSCRHGGARYCSPAYQRGARYCSPAYQRGARYC